MKLTIRSNYGGGDSGGDPVRWFRQKTVRIEDGATQALEQAMDDGAESMRYHIMSRGTAKSGKAGRVDTGKMLSDVTSKVYPGTEKGNQVGRFGWIENREDYYGFQEGGFEHVNGGTVEGMYAMVDAREIAFREFQLEMGSVVRDA